MANNQAQLDCILKEIENLENQIDLKIENLHNIKQKTDKAVDLLASLSAASASDTKKIERTDNARRGLAIAACISAVMCISTGFNPFIGALSLADSISAIIMHSKYKKLSKAFSPDKEKAEQINKLLEMYKSEALETQREISLLYNLLQAKINEYKLLAESQEDQTLSEHEEKFINKRIAAEENLNDVRSITTTSTNKEEIEPEA